MQYEYNNKTKQFSEIFCRADALKYATMSLDRAAPEHPRPHTTWGCGKHLGKTNVRLERVGFSGARTEMRVLRMVPKPREQS